jgi:hypothetical protein
MPLALLMRASAPLRSRRRRCRTGAPHAPCAWSPARGCPLAAAVGARCALALPASCASHCPRAHVDHKQADNRRREDIHASGSRAGHASVGSSPDRTAPMGEAGHTNRSPRCDPLIRRRTNLVVRSPREETPSMKRRLVALGAAAALFVGAPAVAPVVHGSPVTPPAALAKTCSGGFKHAVINGAGKCLRRGQFCARAADGQYRRYGRSRPARPSDRSGRGAPSRLNLCLKAPGDQLDCARAELVPRAGRPRTRVAG